MTLPLSGPMTAAMINVELGKEWNAPFSITSDDCRKLANVLTGPIKMSDFYGKSNAGPPEPDGSGLFVAVNVETGNARYGYDQGTNYWGGPFGSLNPIVIATPGEALACRAMFWDATDRLIFVVLDTAPQYINREYTFKDKFGNLLFTAAITGWQGWTPTTILGQSQYLFNTNPFPLGETLYVTGRKLNRISETADEMTRLLANPPISPYKGGLNRDQ